MALLHQFLVFGTDNAGIERSLRFVQALVSLIATCPTPQIAALLYFTSINIPPAASFLQLRSKINLARRLLRFFRFLEQFKLGWDFYASVMLNFDTLLGVIGKTSMGIFGMLESATLLDLLEIDRFEIFGAEQTANLNYQAQYFWLIALCISLFRSATRLLCILGNQVASSPPSNKEKEKAESSPQSVNDPAPRKPNVNQRSGLGNQIEKRNGATQSSEAILPLIMKLVADAMDWLLPASAVGLVQLDSEMIAVAMIISTAITANDVWARCGREMHRR